MRDRLLSTLKVLRQGLFQTWEFSLVLLLWLFSEPRLPSSRLADACLWLQVLKLGRKQFTYGAIGPQLPLCELDA